MHNPFETLLDSAELSRAALDALSQPKGEKLRTWNSQ
jgi:hypothetical protein